MYTYALGPGRTVELQQTLEGSALQPLFADEWTASHVWPCAGALADCLASRGTWLEGRRLVELGSGCGLVALVAACLGASVVATDKASVVPLLQRNASHNLQGPELARCTAAALPWGDTDALRGVLEGGRVDVVAVSDCLNPLYGLHSYKLLAETLAGLCSAGTEVLVAYEQRGSHSTDPPRDSVFGAFLGHLGPGWAVQLLHRHDAVHVYTLARP